MSAKFRNIANFNDSDYSCNTAYFGNNRNRKSQFFIISAIFAFAYSSIKEIGSISILSRKEKLSLVKVTQQDYHPIR